MATLFAFLLIALVVSFICSMLESVILSMTHTHIAIMMKKGWRSGGMLHDLKKNINHPLAAILTLNTMANTLGAAGVGAQSYYLFGKEWVALSSGILTVLILVISEIIPKTIGAVYWKKLATPSAYLLKTLIIITFPIVKILETVSHIIASKGPVAKITREELLVLADIGLREGILQKKEARIFENLLLLSEIRTGDILTPRSVLLAFQKDLTIKDVVTSNSPIQFSRIPVFDSSLDKITGIILKSELIEAYYTGRENEPIEKLSTPLFAVPESRSITGLFDDFISRRDHIFLVVDEYGGTAGIVTLEDAVETLLGVEIVDEVDSVDDMRAFALEQWKKSRKRKQTLGGK